VEPSGTVEPASAPLPGGVSLQPNERVLGVMYRWWFATAPFHLFTLGLYEFWRRRRFIALTTERLLHCRGILLFKAQRSIPMDRVQDAAYKRYLWMGAIEISSAGGSFGKITDTAFKPSRTKEFVARVQDRIEQFRCPSRAASQDHRLPPPVTPPRVFGNCRRSRIKAC
jgi:hypothetical protein